MIINSVELHNFGRFKGNNLFTISTNESKNIILVRAMNDRGKTTFFNAIKFALYGNQLLQGKEVEEFVNVQAMSEGPGEMFVEIKFEHDGDNFTIKRSVSFEKTPIGEPAQINGSDQVTIWEGNQPKKLKSREMQNRWIGHILPEDASQFFFFDGEEIKRYIAKQSNEKVKSAIEIVLGIKELLNAEEDIEKTLREFRRDETKQLKTKTDNVDVRDELEKLEEDMEEKRTRLDQAIQEKENARSLIQKYDDELKKYSAIETKVKERERVAIELDRAKEQLESLQNELTELRSYNGMFLLSPLITIIDRLDEDPPSFKMWESDTIKRLLKEKPEKCICDRPLDENIFQSIKTKIIETKPSKRNLLRQAAADILKHENPEYKRTQLDGVMIKISDTLQNIDQYKDTITDLDQAIGESLEVGDAIKSMNQNRMNTYQSIGGYDKEIKDLEEEIKSKKEIHNKKKEVLIRGINDEELDRAERLVEFTEKIQEAISSAIKKVRNKRIDTIEKYISDVFKILTNNPKTYVGLKLEDNYEIKVRRYDDTILPTYRYSPSAGASQIIATSLIAGLNKYTTRDAPIIIDTPLARLDPVHRKNLIKFYHDLSKQVIILYQPGELGEKDIVLFQDNVASEWEIKDQLHNSACSVITMVNNYID